MRFLSSYFAFLGGSHGWSDGKSMFGPTQGPSWWCARLSVKFDSSVRISGRLVRHVMGWHRLSHFGLSWIFQLVLAAVCQYCFPYWDLLLWVLSSKWLSCLAGWADLVSDSLMKLSWMMSRAQCMLKQGRRLLTSLPCWSLTRWWPLLMA